MLEFKGKKTKVQRQTNCCNELKRLKSGLINKIHLFNKYLLSVHYVPDTLRHSSYYSTEEKKKDDTQDTSMIKPPNIDHTKMFRLSTWMDDGAIY